MPPACAARPWLYRLYRPYRRRHVFHCLERDLPGQNYSEPFQAWLDAFPREQIMLLQYESLTAPEHVASHLRAVKR